MSDLEIGLRNYCTAVRLAELEDGSILSEVELLFDYLLCLLYIDIGVSESI